MSARNDIGAHHLGTRFEPADIESQSATCPAMGDSNPDQIGADSMKLEPVDECNIRKLNRQLSSGSFFPEVANIFTIQFES